LSAALYRILDQMRRNHNSRAVNIVRDFQNISKYFMPVNFAAPGADGKYFSLISTGNYIVEYGITDFLFVGRSADDGNAFRFKQVFNIVSVVIVHFGLPSQDLYNTILHFN
jgi:hypothetical protein